MKVSIKKLYYNALFFTCVALLPCILYTMEQDTPNKTKSEIEDSAQDALAPLPKEIVQEILTFVVEGNTMEEAYNSINAFLSTNKKNFALFDDAFSKKLVDILHQQFMPKNISSLKWIDKLNILDNGIGLIKSLKTPLAKKYAQARLEEWMANNTNNLLIAAIKENRLETVKFLIENANANINFRAPGLLSYTPLMLAAHHNKFEIVSYLLKAGADKTITSPEDKTALNIARNKGHRDIAELLEKQHDIPAKEESEPDKSR